MKPPDSPEEQKKRIASRWQVLSDFFYLSAQTLTPFAQVPVINLITNPIMNGCWGVAYGAWVIAFKYNPTLKPKKTQKESIDIVQSAFKITSYIVGAIATVSAGLVLLPPLWPAIPVLLPVAAIATTTSAVLWAIGGAVDLSKELKKGIQDAARKWRIGFQTAILLQNISSIVIAAMVIATLLTPAGWIPASAMLTFALIGAAATVSFFSMAKFCKWRAEKAVQSPAESMPEVSYIQLEEQEHVEFTPEQEPNKKSFLTDFHKEKARAPTLETLCKESQTQAPKPLDKEETQEKGAQKPPNLR